MIPIKNKKKSLEVTVDEMRNFSFAYIEKYAPSRQQLKTYLLKKYIKSKIPNVNKKNIIDLIDVVLEDLENTEFLNDQFYSDSKAKSLIQRGSSINKIRQYLMSKGVKNNYIKYTSERFVYFDNTSLHHKLPPSDTCHHSIQKHQLSLYTLSTKPLSLINQQLSNDHTFLQYTIYLKQD